MSTKTNSPRSVPAATTESLSGFGAFLVAILGDVGALFASAVRAVAFWAAVLLPFVVLGVLTADGIAASASAIAGLVGANALCAVVGHDYTP